MKKFENLKVQLGNQYKFIYMYDIDKLKKIMEEQQLSCCDDVVYMLEAGCVNLEVSIFYNGRNLCLGYDVCIRSCENKGKWQSFDSLPDEVNLNVLDMEEEMYCILSKFVEKNNLSYTQFNVPKHDDIVSKYPLSNQSNIIQMSTFKQKN